MDPSPAPFADARCARHPDLAAVFVCRRCGAFGCDACRADAAAGLCQACVARAQAALSAPVTVGETLARSFKLPVEHWQAVLLCLLVGLLPDLLWALSVEWLVPGPRGTDTLWDAFAKGRSYDLATIRQLLMEFSPRLAATAAAKSVAFVIGLFGAGALVVTFASATEGRTAPLRATYALSLRRLLPLVAANVLVQLAASVGLLFCLLPGLAVTALGLLVDPLVLLSRLGPFSAISASVRMCLKVAAPVVVVFLLYTALVFGLSMPLGVLTGMAHGHPLARNVVDALGSSLQDLALVPAIAASGFLYVRLEAWRKQLAAEAAETAAARPAA